MVFSTDTISPEEEGIILEEIDEETLNGNVCRQLDFFPRCKASFQRFKGIVTSSIANKLDTLIINMNAFPQKMIDSTVNGSKRVGGKIWMFGDIMAGVDRSRAPITTESLQIVDRLLYYQSPAVPILIELAETLKNIAPEERPDYIVNIFRPYYFLKLGGT